MERNGKFGPWPSGIINKKGWALSVFHPDESLEDYRVLVMAILNAKYKLTKDSNAPLVTKTSFGYNITNRKANEGYSFKTRVGAFILRWLLLKFNYTSFGEALFADTKIYEKVKKCNALAGQIKQYDLQFWGVAKKLGAKGGLKCIKFEKNIKTIKEYQESNCSNEKSESGLVDNIQNFWDFKPDLLKIIFTSSQEETLMKDIEFVIFCFLSLIEVMMTVVGLDEIVIFCFKSLIEVMIVVTWIVIWMYK
jgi:hypothetical protein